MKVVVTGANGQVGQALQSIAGDFTEIDFYFADSNNGDITDNRAIGELFSNFKPDFCINAAAYTAVDKAESESEKARSINVDGVKNLAEKCLEYNCTLIHISTDFVFDGTKSAPYLESDIPNPQSVYGQTKLDGEKAIEAVLKKYIIVRTSWVYSDFGNNFMKTMLRLSKEREQLSVVDDQIGTPTNALDLAEAILKIIRYLYPEPNNLALYGIYNFSNDGQCSWYQFAKEIFRINDIEMNLHPIKSADFPVAASRPKYSVLDKQKIKTTFGISVSDWREGLKPHQ